jgi:hypothetical protein
MRTAYKVLAYLVAAEVAVQAMFAVWAVAGLSNWVDGGGVFDKAVIEGAAEGGAMPFSEILGIILHGINGTVVIPVIALALLIVSFVTKVHGAIRLAARDLQSALRRAGGPGRGRRSPQPAAVSDVFSGPPVVNCQT